MSSLQKKVLTAGIPRGLPPRPFGGRGQSRGGRGGRCGGRVYTPLHWSKYFKSTKKIQVNKSIFHIYQGTFYSHVSSREGIMPPCGPALTVPRYKNM
jgi:hypothetical protein